MASQQAGQEVAFNADQFSGQNKRNKDEFLNQVSDALMQEAVEKLANAQADQPPNFTSQATNFLQQQRGEQVKNMAQGAADAIKSTFGMNDNHNASSTAKNTSNPANSSGTTTAGAGQQQP